MCCGSVIRAPKKTYSGSSGQKNTGSRIHNTAGRCFSWTTVWLGREGEELISTKKVLLSGVPMLESVGRGGNSESLLLSLDTTVVEIRLQRNQRIWHMELTRSLQNIFTSLMAPHYAGPCKAHKFNKSASGYASASRFYGTGSLWCSDWRYRDRRASTTACPLRLLGDGD